MSSAVLLSRDGSVVAVARGGRQQREAPHLAPLFATSFIMSASIYTVLKDAVSYNVIKLQLFCVVHN